MSESTQSFPLSAVRAYKKVVEVLRDRVNSGHYQVGEYLPSERILGEDFNVDRGVVRAAVNQLVGDGLVERQPHCRPVVIRAQQERPDIVEPASGHHARDPLSPSNCSALIMWHGGGVLEHQSSQQRVFWGINHALAEMGYHAVFLDIGHLGSEENNAKREAAHLQYVIDKGFGGVIFYPYAYRSNQKLVAEVMRHIPLVMIDRRISPLETDFVCTANYKAMFDTVMHLIQQGHRRIAYVTKFEPISPVQDRTQGYLDAVRQANINDMVLTIPSNEIEAEWAVVDTMFGLPEGKRPTAAVVFNDYSACGLLDRLERLGLSVPRDVALTGFDNITPSLQNGLGLTTVAQPYEEIGMQAARLVIKRMQEPSSSFQTIELPGELIVRASSTWKVPDQTARIKS